MSIPQDCGSRRYQMPEDHRWLSASNFPVMKLWGLKKSKAIPFRPCEWTVSPEFSAIQKVGHLVEHTHHSRQPPALRFVLFNCLLSVNSRYYYPPDHHFIAEQHYYWAYMLTTVPPTARKCMVVGPEEGQNA
jgi:hypothetical protein